MKRLSAGRPRVVGFPNPGDYVISAPGRLNRRPCKVPAVVVVPEKETGVDPAAAVGGDWGPFRLPCQ